MGQAFGKKKRKRKRKKSAKKPKSDPNKFKSGVVRLGSDGRRYKTKGKKGKKGGSAKAKAVVVDTKKQKVSVTFSSRGGKKLVTHVVGLQYFENVTLGKELTKALGKRFACATSSSPPKSSSGYAETIVASRRKIFEVRTFS